MKFKAISAGLLAGAFLIPTSASAQMFDGRTLLGAGIGAGLGGVLGSNLAGGGVQQEGTAIGAVLGGLAGAAIANSGRGGYRGSSRYGNNWRGNYGYNGGGYNYRYGYSYGYNNGGYAYPQTYQLPATQYVYGGHVVSDVYTVRDWTTHVYHPAPRPIPVIHKVIHHQPAPVQRIKTIHIYKPAPPPIITLPRPHRSNVYCYAGSNKRYDHHGKEIIAGGSSCS